MRNAPLNLYYNFRNRKSPLIPQSVPVNLSVRFLQFPREPYRVQCAFIFPFSKMGEPIKLALEVFSSHPKTKSILYGQMVSHFSKAKKGGRKKKSPKQTSFWQMSSILCTTEFFTQKAPFNVRNVLVNCDSYFSKNNIICQHVLYRSEIHGEK